MESIFMILFVKPLKLLYFEGPKMLGGFAGLPPHDICAILTGSDSNNWIGIDSHSPACQTILDRNFRSFYIGIAVPAYFVGLLWFVRLLLTCILTRSSPSVDLFKRTSPVWIPLKLK